MATDYPTHFYKYQSADDRAIQNLLECKAVFSSRLNFNDPFDCHIRLIEPTPEETVILLASNQGKYDHYFKGKEFEEGRQALILNANKAFNKMINNYTFYCLSSSGKNNLMWSYYADAHKGFCIEFKADTISADKVSYEKSLPFIKLADFLGTDENHLDLGKNIWTALRLKLDEWKHEDEYRFQPDNSMQSVSILDDGMGKIFTYPPDWIESIIFGYRASPDTINRITKDLPKARFKKASPLNGTIDIVDL